jgi:hypothetical protein
MTFPADDKKIQNKKENLASVPQASKYRLNRWTAPGQISKK